MYSAKPWGARIVYRCMMDETSLPRQEAGDPERLPIAEIPNRTSRPADGRTGRYEGFPSGRSKASIACEARARGECPRKRSHCEKHGLLKDTCEFGDASQRALGPIRMT